MSGNKEKKQFEKTKSGYKNLFRKFSIGLAAMIFIFGGAFAVFKHFKKPTKQSETQTTPALSTIPDWWYQKYFATNVCNTDDCKPDADPDKDGLTNQQEFYYHTDPHSAFTVKDTLNDGQLVAAGFDPSRSNRMTFDQASSDDNILGESLALNSDLRQIVNDQNDISKIDLPIVADDQLKITYQEDDATYKAYGLDLKNTMNKYLPTSNMDDFLAILKTANGSNLDEIKTKSQLLATDLKKITVPNKMLTYHKYVIAFFDLLSKVLLNTNDPSLSSSGADGDAWYHNAQALFAVSQKLNFEAQRLGIKLQQ